MTAPSEAFIPRWGRVLEKVLRTMILQTRRMDSVEHGSV